MSAVRRLGRVASGAAMLGAGALLGTLLGAPGCGLWRPCPELDPLRPGRFEIVDGGSRPELVGGVLVAGDDGVEIRYTLPNGSDWVITYAIDARVPE